MYKHLSVGVAVKRVSGGLELGTQLLKVVDLAVECDGHIAVDAGHRLATRLRQVQDGQAAKAHRHVAVKILATHIGAAMNDTIHHGLKDGLFILDAAGESDESAHRMPFVDSFIRRAQRRAGEPTRAFLPPRKRPNAQTFIRS